jgi:hypothetical protein
MVTDCAPGGLAFTSHLNIVRRNIVAGGVFGFVFLGGTV